MAWGLHSNKREYLDDLERTMIEGIIPDIKSSDYVLPTYEEMEIWELLVEFVKEKPKFQRVTTILNKLKW